MEVARQELPDLALAENVATLCRHKAAPGDLEHANPEHRKKRASNLAADTNQRRPFGTCLLAILCRCLVKDNKREVFAGRKISNLFSFPFFVGPSSNPSGGVSGYLKDGFGQGRSIGPFPPW